MSARFSSLAGSSLSGLPRATQFDSLSEGYTIRVWRTSACGGTSHPPLLIIVYLTGVHLIGVHLTGVHLTGVHLTGVHLTGVHLTGVHLTGVHFTGVHLIGV